MLKRRSLWILAGLLGLLMAVCTGCHLITDTENDTVAGTVIEEIATVDTSYKV
jgi:hypothetical protein